MLSVESRSDAHDHPEDDRETDDARDHAVLPEPCTDPSLLADASAGIGTAPARQAAAPGEHVLYMHHEVLVRELALAQLVSEFVLEYGFRRVDAADPRPRLRADDRPRGRVLLR
ncbi:MAG: hypothetical protein ACYDC2_08300 [Solirubrobacteraceae bacterium]